MNADAPAHGDHPRLDLGSLGIGLVSSHTDVARAAEALLRRRYDFVPEEEAQTLVALGGDGFMLQTLHRHGALGKPVYGLKLGTVGFLMNHYQGEAGSVPDLMSRLEGAEPAVLRPLEMVAATESGASVGSLAPLA